MSAQPAPRPLTEPAIFDSAITHAELWNIADARLYAAAKRCFDFVLALLLLLVLAPVLLIIVILIRTDSKGPAIYRQKRCGRYGREFTFYKFRTMHIGSEAQLDELWPQNEMTGPVFKMRRDPRVTSLGHWLRKTSMDELPQLLNVLCGEMSLVGPRPPITEEVAFYSEREWTRLSVKPGITCLWQVMGRSTLSFERWMELDLEYIARRGFWYDLWIVVRTVPAVALARGAF